MSSADILRSIAIEVANSPSPKLWEADDLSDEDMAAFALAGVEPQQARDALAAKLPFRPTHPIVRHAKRYRDMDDDEFDRTWDDERGNQAGIPL